MYYVYFLVHREMGRPWYLKIGHCKNIKSRFSSYNSGYYQEATLLTSIEVGTKSLSCEIERGYIRILDHVSGGRSKFRREWFELDNEIVDQLKKWGMKIEKPL